MLKLSSSISLQRFTMHWTSYIFQWNTVCYLFFVSAPSLLSMLMFICLDTKSPFSALSWCQEIVIYTFLLLLDICFCSVKGRHWQEVTEGEDAEVTSPWLPILPCWLRIMQPSMNSQLFPGSSCCLPTCLFWCGTNPSDSVFLRPCSFLTWIFLSKQISRVQIVPKFII